jgi:hypothetical protein
MGYMVFCYNATIYQLILHFFSFRRQINPGKAALSSYLLFLVSLP